MGSRAKRNFSARLLPESNVEHDMHLRLSRYQVISPAIRDFNGNRRRDLSHIVSYFKLKALFIHGLGKGRRMQHR